jgi:hypothetical protein
LPDDDFATAVKIAQEEFDRHQPDVVVGSSRGEAVAMNINIGSACATMPGVEEGRDADILPGRLVQTRHCQWKCKMIQAINLRFVAILFMAVLVLSLTGCGDSKITKSNYDLIEIGMKEAAVEAILGKGTIPTNTAWLWGDSPPGAATVKEWKEGTKQITIEFSNGMVWRKNKGGL